MSIRFNAVADMLLRTTNLPTVTSFSIMGWFRHESLPTAANAMIVYNGTASYELQVKSSTGQLALWNGSTEVQGTTLTASQWGNWQHYAMTCAGTGAGQLFGYLNGVLDITHAGNASANGTSLSFGNTNPGTDLMTGLGCAIKIYSNRVLTAGEIRQEMYQLAPFNPAGLNSWYPLADLGTALRDFGPYSYTATLGGTVETAMNPPVPWLLRRRPAAIAKRAAAVFVPYQPAYQVAPVMAQ